MKKPKKSTPLISCVLNSQLQLLASPLASRLFPNPGSSLYLRSPTSSILTSFLIVQPAFLYSKGAVLPLTVPGTPSSSGLPAAGLALPSRRCQTLGAFVGQNGRTLLEGPSSFLRPSSLHKTSTLRKRMVWKRVCDT